MEQAIRAELWEVLDTSDLESVTSKEVGWGVPGWLGRSSIRLLISGS